MAELNISVGNYEVLTSGIVVGCKDKPIVFHISPLTIEIEFKDDPDNGETRTDSLIEGQTLKLMMINFNSPLEFGNIDPWEIGTLNSKKLFLSFRITAPNISMGKSLTYTWLLEG